MRHAFLIFAHSDKGLLKTLIAMLDHEQNDIYLHIDRKCKDFSPEDFSTTKAGLYRCPRRKIYWGHHGMVETELELFAQARQRGGYAYYHVFSGSDLPIKSQQEIHRFFSKHKGKEFVSYWQEEGHRGDARLKVIRYHLGLRWEKIRPRLLSILVAKVRYLVGDLLTALLGERDFPWTIYKGANWVSVTESFVDYLLEHREQIVKRYKYTRSGDEIFIQSLLWDSPFREQLYRPSQDRSQEGYRDDACLREIYWRDDANSPEVWRLKDLDQLLCSPNLFARKFSTSVDAEIIAELYKRLG